MSDTDDTDVLVLIPHDFFTVSSSEEERPVTEVTRPLQRRFYSPNTKNMSQDKTPTKPLTLSTSYKNGETYPPRRSLDYSSFRKSDISPQKSFQLSPSKGQNSPKTLPLSNNTSRLRHSTSDLPNLSDGTMITDSHNATTPQGSNQRQRSFTGEMILSQNTENLDTNHAGADKHDSSKVFKNPEQPEYDNNPPKNVPSTPKDETKQGTSSDKTLYVGENQDLPYVCGDNIGAIPDLGFGIREFLASLKPTYPQSARMPREPVNEEPCTKRYFSPLGGEAAANVAGSRRQLNFDEHEVPTSSIGSHADSRPDKLNLSAVSAVKRPSAFVPVGSGETRIIGEHQPASLPSDLSRPELTGSSAARSPNVAIPSLMQLWREEKTGEAMQQKPASASTVLLQQRLEEERYRRLHCEQLISELQQKLLRESERVAVATQVDARKDDYLTRLRESYEGTARQWQFEQERLKFEITEKNEMCAATIQRLRGCERELSKALDLASGFQQRSLELEREKTETEAALRSRIATLERHCNQLEQEALKMKASFHISEQQDNKKVEQMATLQNLLEDERRARYHLEEENKKLIREAEEKEASLLTLEAERDTQQSKLQDMKHRNELIEQQKTAIQQSLEELKKKERSARQELRDLGQAMEQSRQSLKEQYQTQLDQVVRAKLAEFQNQLDSAEAALRQQWENREAEARSKHARALSEIEQRHLGELRQVEERHSRDIAWWKQSLSQAISQIQELTSELERQEKHREQLAGKIKYMLQAQYKQATNLIWEPSEANGMGKMNGAGVSDFKGWGSLPSMNQGSSSRQCPPVVTSTSEAQINEAGAGTKTVLSSHAHEELKKYIEMLLQRPAGDPLHGEFLDGASQGSGGKNPYIPDLDLSKLSINLPDNKPKVSKDNQKPPWK